MTTTVDGEIGFFMLLFCHAESHVSLTRQAAHEELHNDRKPAFPGYPVIQPASDWLS